MIKTISITLILMSIFCGPNVFGGKLYKWVDEKGNIHFSDRIPEDQKELSTDIQESDLKEIFPNKKQKNSNTNIPHKNPIQHTVESTFTIKNGKSMGTGFFISPNGYAITCKHVIEDNQAHVATLNDQTEYPIGIISTSDSYDLALILVITSRKTPYLSFKKQGTMIPGERVYAVGSSIGLQSTVTDGIYTGLRKLEETGDKVLQFSAPVNPGNSGGPLVDTKGKLIGVVSWKIVSKNGITINGVGFAVPSEYLIEEYSAYIE